MKKQTDIATAANSKTMNAVGNINLFAAAGETDPVINFEDGNKGLTDANSSGDKSNRKKKHKNN
ncbi:MAG: hypothetical protein ABIQ31_22365 [Ferruginibacter sp.]